MPLRIGDLAAGCAGNRVAGGVSVTGNTGGSTLGANIVAGAMTVDNNSVGQVLIKANNVDGTLSCTGNAPAPSNGGATNTASTKSGAGL